MDKQHKCRADWITAASKIIREITSAQLDIDTLFPTQEYLHPFSRAKSSMQLRIIKFLRFDTERLVDYSKIKDMLERGKKMRVNKGDILFTEIKDIVSKTKEIRQNIESYEALSHRTYPEAKYLFAQLLKTGIWIPEARILKKIIEVNTKVEEYLLGNFEGAKTQFKEFIKLNGKYIDQGFENDISNKYSQIEQNQLRHSIILDKHALEFDDFEKIKELLAEDGKMGPCKEDRKKLEDLHQGFLWVFRLALALKIKSGSLSDLIQRVHSFLQLAQGTSEFQSLSQQIFSCSQISYSKPPLSNVIQEGKLSAWRSKVRNVIGGSSFTLEDLQALQKECPTMEGSTIEETETNNLIGRTINRANKWINESHSLESRVMAIMGSKKEEIAKPQLKGELSNLEKNIAKLTRVYKDSLFRITSLSETHSKLQYLDELIFFMGVTHNLVNKEKVELNLFQRAFEIVKTICNSKEDERIIRSPSFTIFKNISDGLIVHLRRIRDFSQTTLKGKELRAEYFFDQTFIQNVEKLPSIQDIKKSLGICLQQIFLADMGFAVKGYIKQYTGGQETALTILESTWDSTERVDGILQELHALKTSNWMIKTNDSVFEKLAALEWVLVAKKASEGNSRTSIETLSLLKSTYNPNYKNPELLESICSLVTIAKQKEEELKALLSCQTNEKVLSDAVTNMEKSRIELAHEEKAIKRILDEAVHLRNDVKDIEKRLSTGGKISLTELLGLEKELLLQRFDLSKERIYIESLVQKGQGILKRNLKFIDLYQKDLDLKNTSTQEYERSNFLIDELEQIRKDKIKSLEVFRSIPDESSILKLDLKGVILLEESLLKTLSIDIMNKVGPVLFLHKVRLLKRESQKISLRRKNPHSQITLQSFTFLLGYIRHICSISGTQDHIEALDWLEEKMEEVKDTLLEIEVRPELIEREKSKLSLTQTILFNFLQLKEQVKSIQRKLNGDNVIGANNLEVVNLEIPSIKTTRDEVRIQRKESIKALNKVLLAARVKELNIAKSLEDKYYRELKENFLDEYASTIDILVKAIHKSKCSIPLFNILKTKYIESKVLSSIVADPEDELRRISGEKEARSYIRVKLGSSRKNSSSLSKRSQRVTDSSSEFDLVRKQLKLEEPKCEEALTIHSPLQSNAIYIPHKQALESQFPLDNPVQKEQGYMIIENEGIKMEDDHHLINEDFQNQNQREAADDESNREAFEDGQEQDHHLMQIDVQQEEIKEEMQAELQQEEIKEEMQAEVQQEEIKEEMQTEVEQEEIKGKTHEEAIEEIQEEEIKEEIQEKVIQEIPQEENIDDDTQELMKEEEKQSYPQSIFNPQEEPNIQIKLSHAKSSNNSKSLVYSNHSQVKKSLEKIESRIEMRDDREGGKKTIEGENRNPNISISLIKKRKPKYTKQIINVANEDPVDEPDNASGTWSVFEGGLELQCTNKGIRMANLVTTEEYHRLREIPLINRSDIVIDEFIRLREFSGRLASAAPIISSGELIAVGGVLDIASWDHELLAALWTGKAAKNVYCYKYGESASLYFLSRADFIETMRGVVSSYSVITKFDKDFYWVLLAGKSGANTKKINPKPYSQTMPLQNPDKENELDLSENDIEEIDWMEVGKQISHNKKSTKKSVKKSIKKSMKKISVSKAAEDKFLINMVPAHMNIDFHQEDNEEDNLDKFLPDLSGDILREKTNQIMIERPLMQGKISIESDLASVYHHK